MSSLPEAQRSTGSTTAQNCERVLYRHRAILLILRVHRDSLLGSSDHMEDDEQNREGEEIGQDVETLEREEEFNGWRDNAQSDT